MPELNFQVSDTEEPFDEEKQLQLCSIDLRISNIFWKEKSTRHPLDLHKDRLAELGPRRRWEKISLRYDDSIILKPGEFILGQTFEKFHIPNRFAGKIITRSSYARMGLETNSATDFLNPGWFGHVPLEIINKSRNKIKLYPLLGMVQIFLIPLSSEPDGNYGDTDLHSKYQNDDGGPSYWWRDKLLGQIRSNYSSRISSEVLNQLIEKFSRIDDEGLYRFEKFMGKLSTEDMDNPANILYKFQAKEITRSRRQKFLLFLPTLAFLPITGYGLVLMFQAYKPFHILVWIAAGLLLPLVIYLKVYYNEVNYYTNITTND